MSDLASELWDLAGDVPPDSPNAPTARIYGRLARAIRENPQAHIDALVEAGVLREIKMHSGFVDSYAVVQPHTHEFWVSAIRPDTNAIFVQCKCGERREFPKRLPIEVPE